MSAAFDIDVTLHRPGRSYHLRLRTPHRRVGVVGPSGAGKTTLLRVLAGLETRATGSVVVEGIPFQGLDVRVPTWERRVGWVPQDATLFPHASVRANLAWAGAEASAVEVLAGHLGIDGVLDRYPRHLSGGERQRVALGRALLARPRLLLLDEPFSALDPERRLEVAGVLDAHLRREGPLLVLVSHDRADLERLVEDVWEARSDGTLRRLGGAGGG